MSKCLFVEKKRSQLYSISNKWKSQKLCFSDSFDQLVSINKGERHKKVHSIWKRKELFRIVRPELRKRWMNLSPVLRADLLSGHSILLLRN